LKISRNQSCFLLSRILRCASVHPPAGATSLIACVAVSWSVVRDIILDNLDLIGNFSTVITFYLWLSESFYGHHRDDANNKNLNTLFIIYLFNINIIQFKCIIIVMTLSINVSINVSQFIDSCRYMKKMWAGCIFVSLSFSES
jgi:hypothetical protein